MKILIFLTSLQPLLLFSLVAQQIPQVEKQTLVSITKETTFITEPLDELGFPDYYAHLNRRAVRIPHNENAGLDIIRVLGADLINESSQRELCRVMGLSEYPTTTQPFVAYKSFIKNREPEKSEEEVQLEHKRFTETLRRTWNDEEFQSVAAWLDSPPSSLTLEVLKSIDGKNQFAIPYLVPGAPKTPWTTYSVLLPHTQHLRDLSQLIVCHANRLVHKKQFEEASAWILRLHHLARLADQQEVLIERLIAFAMDAMASHAEFVLATHPQCPDKILRDHQFRRVRLPAFSKLQNSLDEDRNMLSQAFCLMARSRLSGQQETTDFLRGTMGFQNLLGETFNQLASGLDYDVVLKLHQELYDKQAVFIDEPFEKSRSLQEEFDQKLRDAAKSINATFDFETLMELPEKERSELLSRWYAYRVFPNIQSLTAARDRARIRATLVLTFLSIERYRRDKGKLPDSLENLIPQYLVRMPVDFYNGGNLSYQRDLLNYQIFSVGENRDGSNKPLLGGSYSTSDVLTQ